MTSNEAFVKFGKRMAKSENNFWDDTYSEKLILAINHLEIKGQIVLYQRVNSTTIFVLRSSQIVLICVYSP